MATNECNLFNLTKSTKHPSLRNPPIKDLNGQWLRSNKEKADGFGIFLRDKFTPFDRRIDINAEKTLLKILDSPYQMDRPLQWINPLEVVREIKNIKIKKSPGCDGINGRLVKCLPHCAVVHLTAVYNSVLRSGHFPTCWKLAEIILINKPGKPENCVDSYRPISLLPIFSKIFERLILNRLQIHLRKIIPNHQFGFRKQHGTIQQCHRVVFEIQNTLENGHYCSAVFLDMKEAFDKVWIPGLITKMKNYLPSPFLPILTSFLVNRKFYVRHRDEKSSSYDVNAGVPQGSVLGPILYTLFTSDMPTSPHIFTATYADDTAFLSSRERALDASNDLQSHLRLVENWCDTWRLRVNPSKCTHVTFTLKTSTCPPVFFYNSQIQKTNSAKYLGLHLDQRLTWQDHIKSKRKQLD